MVPTRRLPLCRSRISLFFPLSFFFFLSLFSLLPLSFSLSLSPSSWSCNFSLYDVARYVRTDTARRAKNGLAAAWWLHADAVIVSFAPTLTSTPSFTSVVRRRAATRSSGMFATWGTSVISPLRRFVFFSSLHFPFVLFSRRKRSAVLLYGIRWNHIVFFPRETMWNFLLQRSVSFSCIRFWD